MQTARLLSAGRYDTEGRFLRGAALCVAQRAAKRSAQNGGSALVERYGIVVTPEDKNAAILPEQVGGEWILFHRPVHGCGTHRPGIALSRSTDLTNWGPRKPSWSLALVLGGTRCGSESGRRSSNPRRNGETRTIHRPGAIVRGILAADATALA